jgi:hypothetical protein
MGNHVVNATGPKSGALSATKQRPVLKPRDPPILDVDRVIWQYTREEIVAIRLIVFTPS